MEKSNTKQYPNNPIDMKIKLIILLSFILFAIKTPAQERSVCANCFGERVIEDYLSFYENQQIKTPNTRFWFEDSDTRQMAASFINSYADSINADTIFFIREWLYVGALSIVPGDTFLFLTTTVRDSVLMYEVGKLPFNNAYSNEYRDDLRAWDINKLSGPSTFKYVVCGGERTMSDIVRLIYYNGKLVSADFCRHGYKGEYNFPIDGVPKDPEILPYPEGKQWPQWEKYWFYKLRAQE